MTVDRIAEATGLHANTVRSHLDVLLATGEVVREREDVGAAGRGRPRWLYRAGAATSPFHFLAEALSVQLARVDEPALADEAAQRWSEALPTLPVAQSPDEAVAEAANALTRLGFAAEVCRAGEAIDLTACPYASLVADNPVICDIHAALVVRLLEQTGQPVSLESMDVWARPGLCRARLRRPDLHAARTITVTPEGAITSDEGPSS
jgi:predicted ArsR family transcriptional regulator